MLIWLMVFWLQVQVGLSHSRRLYFCHFLNITIKTILTIVTKMAASVLNLGFYFKGSCSDQPLFLFCQIHAEFYREQKRILSLLCGD